MSWADDSVVSQSGMTGLRAFYFFAWVGAVATAAAALRSSIFISSLGLGASTFTANWTSFMSFNCDYYDSSISSIRESVSE